MTGLLRRCCVLLTALLMCGCQYLGPVRAGQNGTFFMGVRVNFVLGDSRDFGVCAASLVGCSIPLGAVCVVQLDRTYFEHADVRRQTLLVAHELGHCIDVYRLAGSHGGFQSEGKRWGPYWSRPAEGFAEAFARVYLHQCGPDLASLGWMGAHGPCTPPNPRTITPKVVEQLGV